MTEDSILVRSRFMAGLLPLVLLFPRAALAHTGGEIGADEIWQEWSFDPLVWIPAILFVWLYLRGVWIRARDGGRVAGWRIALYLGGVGLVWAALASPLDYMAEHLFWMHQIQHMVLRITAPLMILFAAPQGVIFAGMPRRMRRWVLAPLIGSRSLRRVGRALSGPAAATVLFILALWVWQIPALHDAALLNDTVHNTMHVTMLLSGILFFWVLFDRRDPPKAAGFAARQGMLAAAIVTEILLGAAITLKTVELYPAYDVVGRLFDIAPMVDETTGGFLIWSPACMMFLLAIMMVIHRANGAEMRQWQRHGTHMGSNSAALMVPETAEELWITVAEKNRRLGTGLALVALTMALLAFGTAETVLLIG